MHGEGAPGRDVIENALKQGGVDPNARLGFGSYIGLNPLDPNPANAQKIASSPLVTSMQEGYEQTSRSYPTKVADDLIEPDIVKAIENPTAEEYATARARGDLIATEAYDHGAEVAKSTASGDVLSEPPPPKSSRKGPGDIGKPADVRTRPSTRGADAASTTTGSTPKPPPTTGSVAMDPPKVPTTPPSSGAPSKMRSLMDDGLEAAKNVAARNPMGIRAAAVAGLLGVGAVVVGRRGQPQSDQRNTYLEESRRKMQG